MKDFLVSTMNDVPGYEVTEVHGEVFGLIARSRNIFSNTGAGLRTIFGGEARGYTKLLQDSRQQAVDRMVEEAWSKGANCVLAAFRRQRALWRDLRGRGLRHSRDHQAQEVAQRLLVFPRP